MLPKRLRDRFHLQSGDSLAIEVKGNAIELRPARSNVRLERVNGVLVVAGRIDISSGRDLVAEMRESRIDEIARGTKKDI